MLIPPTTIDGIVAGTITVAFRRWDKPRINVGSRIRNARGVVEITSLEEVRKITEKDARAAGFESAAALLKLLDKKSTGDRLYRIGVTYGGPDPRHALRESGDIDADELASLRKRLARMDGDAPWTRTYLQLIADNPEVVARELAPLVGMERDPFKIKVRRLKDLGLTASLLVGYRISPRGKALLDADEGVLEP
jgi:hypothetical protein